jgi:hypothetical protein
MRTITELIEFQGRDLTVKGLLTDADPETNYHINFDAESIMLEGREIIGLLRNLTGETIREIEEEVEQLN